MILNRLGNKDKLIKDILPHFPAHDVYMEPFFGTGSMFFNKPKVKYNFLADKDEDVFNLFRTIIDHKEELVHRLEMMPIDETLAKSYSKGKREVSNIDNAVRFLLLSNFTLFGKGDTLRLGIVDPKSKIISKVDATFKKLTEGGTYFFKSDFRKFFSKANMKGSEHRTLVYTDPPYLDTADNYQFSFKEKDSKELFEVLVNSGHRFFMSEFDHPFILKQAELHGLRVIVVGQRTNIRNKRTEVLITNVGEKTQQSLF